MRAYGQARGWTVGRAHARSGDRIVTAAYLGHSAAFDLAIGEFATAYAGQNERHYGEPAGVSERARDGHRQLMAGGVHPDPLPGGY